MALLEARADHVPRRPYRACANTAQPARPTSQGVKITELPQIYTATPPTANRRTPSPAHKLTASRTLTGLERPPSDRATAGIYAAPGRLRFAVVRTYRSWRSPACPPLRGYQDTQGQARAKSRRPNDPTVGRVIWP
jgi:hypothetical protein